MSDPERIAICGGTFDPIHRGHVEPVMSVFQQAGWLRVIFIPAYQQPFKTDRSITSAFHRFAMVVLATQENERLEVDPIELERGAVSYTVDTLEQLHARYRNAIFDWIIGDDNLNELAGWKNLQRIFDLANFAVLHRSGNRSLSPALATRVLSVADHPRKGAIIFLNNPVVPISATEIRRKLANGEDVRGLLHPSVELYLRRHHLYQATVKGEHVETR
jgi:nicotinate-nucleotide adenylyltransferase